MTSIVQTRAYRRAFVQHLRTGTPIHLTLKQDRATEQYVWRAQDDGKVRPEHRRNDGRVFSWEDEPPTGHPGEDHNCRCEAIPYVRGQTEFAFHESPVTLGALGDRWEGRRFVAHFYLGGGRAVTLHEIGHLREIVEHYAYEAGVEGAYRRLSGQIASAARDKGPGAFEYEFRGAYGFGDVEFSHGGGEVRGTFSGVAEDRGAIYSVRGASSFEFHDVFTDPLGMEREFGGTPYHITGQWRAAFTAEVFKDEARSDFFHREEH